MNEREQRGLQIAALCNLKKKDGGTWLVLSQAGKGSYTVTLDPVNPPHCDCPDHLTRGVECKHIFAARFTVQREQNVDGSITETVTETIAVQRTTKRTTYRQDWKAYNAAQTNEKDKFLDLLRDLVAGVPEPEQAKTGRPRLSLRDAIFAACYKIYSTVSCRRFMSDLRAAQESGHIEKCPHFNSIFNYLENPALTPILRGLIAESAKPMKAVEVDFAVDSSGFSTSRFIRWFDQKYGKLREHHEWVKVHLMCGIKTNIVTAVEIHDKNANDSPLLPPLVNATAKSFKPREVSADKQYGSFANYDAIDAVGATPFIPFKSIHTGSGNGLWAKMFGYFMFRRDEFLGHYHKRSNVESTFGMIKAKFRDHIRSKGDVAMVNEVLCKLICHNICVLIQESYELGVLATFWAETPVAQEVTVG